MQKKTKMIRKTLLLIILVAVFCVLPAQAATQESRENVKVGYFALGSYFQIDEEGVVSGYDIGYLDKISEYTNLDFTYVDCGSWENALSMLENQEIDLLGTMQWSEERSERFAICDHRYGVTYATLAALEESDYLYEDYEAFRTAKIACTASYVGEQKLQQLLDENEITSELVHYDDILELSQALEDGEVDMIATHSHLLRDNWKILEKYAYSPLYFASWKGNEALTNKIDEAILAIDLYEKAFEENLLNAYFPRLIETPFTREEVEFIGQHDTMTFCFENNTAPVTYQDAESGEIKGILVEACNLIGAETGLNFAYTSVKNAEIDVNYEYSFAIMPEDMSEKQLKERSMTNPVIDCNYFLYHIHGEKYDVSEGASYKVAIPVNRDGYMDFFADKYPNYELIECDSPIECVDMLLQGDCDLAFLNYYVANDIIVKENLTEVDAIPISEIKMGICLQIKNENTDLLIPIINKGIGMLDEDAMQQIVLDYALATTPDATMRYFIQNHTVTVIVLCVLFAALLSLIAYTAMRSKMLQKEKAVLAVANAHLKDATDAKTDFLSRVSHDLRTPMNAILGLSELGLESESLEESKEQMIKINDSGKYLLSLINDTLDMNKIESNLLELKEEPVEAGEWLQKIVASVRVLAEQKGVNFHFDYAKTSPLYVKVDVLRTEQIFMNLLSNAIKFTEKGGEVSFKANFEPVGNLYYKGCFVVSDTGIGMSREFMKNMYEPFTQEDNHAFAGQKGSGLGLSIAKRLVEMMGGTIEAESQPGKGTTFTICWEMPATEEIQKAKTVAGQPAYENLKHKHVLLCEDHPLNTEIAVKLLEKQDMIVDTVANGAEAVKAFQSSEMDYYDVILMDIRMPVMDGLEAATAIRGLGRLDALSVPIIALTANAYENDMEKSRQAGMNVHLSKPIEPLLLYQTILNLLMAEEAQ